MNSDSGAKKEIAKTEFEHWNSYLEFRKQNIKETEALREQKVDALESAEALADSGLGYSHVIQPKDERNLKEYFDRFKDRKTYKVSSDRLTSFHGEVSKVFGFNVPLHPKNLS